METVLSKLHKQQILDGMKIEILSDRVEVTYNGEVPEGMNPSGVIEILRDGWCRQVQLTDFIVNDQLLFTSPAKVMVPNVPPVERPRKGRTKSMSGKVFWSMADPAKFLREKGSTIALNIPAILQSKKIWQHPEVYRILAPKKSMSSLSYDTPMDIHPDYFRPGEFRHKGDRIKRYITSYVDNPGAKPILDLLLENISDPEINEGLSLYIFRDSSYVPLCEQAFNLQRASPHKFKQTLVDRYMHRLNVAFTQKTYGSTTLDQPFPVESYQPIRMLIKDKYSDFRNCPQHEIHPNWVSFLQFYP